MNTGTPVWSLTYTSDLHRVFPRPSCKGEGEICPAKGYLMTEEAYKKNLIFYVKTFQMFDDQYGAHAPKFNWDVDKEWGNLPRYTEDPLLNAIFYLS